MINSKEILKIFVFLLLIILVFLVLYQNRIISKLQNRVYELENFEDDNKLTFELFPMEY